MERKEVLLQKRIEKERAKIEEIARKDLQT
jgi:hypothetical protein